MNRCLVMSLLLSCVTLHAQDVVEQEKRVSIRLLASSLLKGADSVVIQSGKIRSGKVMVPTHGLSSPVLVNGRQLVLGLIPEKGNGPIKPLAKIQLPQQGRKFLLLLVPNNHGYSCKVIRLDYGNFQGGDTLFYNVGDTSIGGMIGKRKFAVSPGKLRIMKAPIADGKPYYQVRFYYNDQGKARIFRDTRWPRDDRSRSYIFFFTNPKTSRVTYRAIDEVVN